MPASRPPRPTAPDAATQRSLPGPRRRRKAVRQRRPERRPEPRLSPPLPAASEPRTRIACIAIPLFPLAARLRCEPELSAEGLAIFEGNAHLARVVAASRAARRAGVRPGMTLAQARARLPRLVVRARDSESERTAQESLLEIAESFSPRVEDPGPEHWGSVYLDIDGLERHFAAPERGDPREDTETYRRQHRLEAEQRLGESLIRRLESAGLPARVGIASSKLAAAIAAGLPSSPHVVAPGTEAEFLAPLPLHRLSPDTEVASTLERWGIHRIGELAHLSTTEVASRLGECGRRLHAVARGLDERPLVARQPPAVFREGMTLEWPIVQLEPFLFLARNALERLAQRLEARGLGCRRLETSMPLEPDGFFERNLELPSPTRDVKTLLTLLRLDLEAHPPGAPIRGFQFTAHPDAPKLAQMSLLGPASLSPDRLAETLARLFALLGPRRVGSPRTEDGHRPERFSLTEYRPPPPPKIRARAEPSRGLLAVRVLRPALELEVITRSQWPRPTDSEVRETGARVVGLDRQAGLFRRAAGREPPVEMKTLVSDDPQLRVEGRVRVASGPWELEECWWSEQRTERDYWDVELDDGALYRIYRNREDDRWWVDGVYD